MLFRSFFAVGIGLQSPHKSAPTHINSFTQHLFNAPLPSNIHGVSHGGVHTICMDQASHSLYPPIRYFESNFIASDVSLTRT